MTELPDSELLNLFWVEVGEYLQKLNTLLLQAEASAERDPAMLREMNRLAHSMKGAARAVGMGVIETLAYYLEEVFASAQAGRMDLSPAVCDLLYDTLDLIQNVVNGIENSTESLALVIARLEQTVAVPPTQHAIPGSRETPVDPLPKVIIPAQPAPAPPAPEPPTLPEFNRIPTPPTKATTAMRPVQDEFATLQLPPADESIRVPVSRMDRLMGEVSELQVARMHSVEQAQAFQKLQKLNQRWQRDWRSVRAAYIRLARRMQHQAETIPEEVWTLFEFLEDNQRHLQESSRQTAHLSREMAQYTAQITMLTEQLQDEISSLRLMPFETLVSAFQRLIRDLARDTGKEVQLHVEGASTEMDKTALDALKEPIMHLLRNSVDHGIEAPFEREATGKPITGTVEIRVEQRGKEILIHISDDGRGLDPERIARAAVDTGLMTIQETQALSIEDMHNLIFQPGLTTKSEVTSLSGRGMGMDIVRIRVESLRGRVSVESAPGRGSTFTLRIPLSLTRLSCILLRVGEENFAVPSVSVTRMMTVKRAQLFTAEGRTMIQIEQQPLPVVPLAPMLGTAPATFNMDELTLMVLTSGDRAIAFEVDELYSEQELVLKSLGREIMHVPHVSGGALLGTGDVIVVLDANALLRGAGVTRVITPGTAPKKKTVTQSMQQVESRKIRILVADDSITTRTLEKHILENAGFEVHTAVDGQEAWERLPELKPDLVISDVEMPRCTGLELTARIKSDARLRHLPVILLTSLAKPEQREAGLHAGADAYLVKSRFEQHELLRVIRGLV
jgi:two-component system chemotaxis sensor kinase CheA